MGAWSVDHIVHFDFQEDLIVRQGQVHFGFHDRCGHHYAVAHQRHFIGLIGADDRLVWTVAASPVFPDVPNVEAALEFPMYVDTLPDDSLVVSNFKSAELYRVDTAAMTASVLVDGRRLGLRDMGNCVVDDDGDIWVNEVTGCRVWRFDASGRVREVLGDGTPGFSRDAVPFGEARFHWIYDLRRGPDGDIYVLDSRNFALRVIDRRARCVLTIAGTGRPGYGGDGGDARDATFGSELSAKFDGPISLALDGAGRAYVGDRFNGVVRMIGRDGRITTIAGCGDTRSTRPNDVSERDPLRVRLPQISSLDSYGGRLFIPTDLGPDSGDLIVVSERAV